MNPVQPTTAFTSKVSVKIVMGTLDCTNHFNTAAWQRAFKVFIKAAGGLKKLSSIGHVTSDQSACSKAPGTDDKYDDKTWPTTAPTSKRRLATGNTLSMTITATNIAASTITSGLNSITNINLSGYPPSTATVTATDVTSSTSAPSSAPAKASSASHNVFYSMCVVSAVVSAVATALLV